MGDSYRPGRPDRDRPPPLADRMTFTSGGGDNYRPGGSQRHQGRAGNKSEFTFESNHPAPHFPPTGPSNAGAREPPRKRNRGGASQRGSKRGDSSRSHGRNNANGFRRGGFRKAPHERALLTLRDDGSPEHAMGVSDGPNKFLNLDDLSDDEEADMEVESDGSIGHDTDADGRDVSQKVARTQTMSRANGDSVPKWSNPDPYTVLPPPEETTGKKTDFVKLIRKAKNQAAEKAAGHNAVAANDDFISFGDEDGDRETSEVRMLEDEASVFTRQRPNAATKRPVQGSLNELDYSDSVVDRSQSSHEAAGLSDQTQYPLRSNKRKHGGFGAGIVQEWLPTPQSNPTPWLLSPGVYAHLAGDPTKWLHNEILDFYDFVAPQPFEHDIRNQLVHRVNSALGSRRFPHESGRILCFGSFPAGLYLPTADMDLVYTSDRHYNGGPPVLDFSKKGAHKSLLYKASRRLTDMRICRDQPMVIANAKVPIIKFTDDLTGLEVDISFENLSGVQAQATFAEWKRQYPDMIYMVALLKQFLVMHGLNEVHTGGIGGFSIICLIVSYLHHTTQPENLGECFLGFLKYYGSFDLARKRIQMYPPAIIDKTSYGIDNRPEKPDGLSIQDPNRLDNNISGGSSKAKDAFKAFALAYRTLDDRMKASKAGQNIGPSILECVLGGNYETYIKQRRHLKSLK
ncbi:Nn.00g059770.m01.CDS01 [Neocucurbitaria sp. VM-36]